MTDISRERENKAWLLWPELHPGILIKRYKRFLADIRLTDGNLITAHCPNSGSMKACSEPGQPVYVSYHDNPKRKLKYTWELIEMPTSLTGVNTQIPNALVKLAIEQKQIPTLKKFDTVIREVKVGENSRIDIVGKTSNKPDCFIEVKNCTLVENGTAYFPDAITSRGLKHLGELQKLKSQGMRAVMFFLIQRMDAKKFMPAKHIDSAYAKELATAVSNGVEIMVYDVLIDLHGIRVNRKIPHKI